MRSWRTTGLALWALAAIAASGCSSTSIPARVTRLATGQVYEDERVPHSRLIAIGKTFEAQGKYNRARRMYRMVLSQKPGHSQAIASLNRLQNLRDGQLPAPTSPVARPARMLAQSTSTPAPVRTAATNTAMGSPTTPTQPTAAASPVSSAKTVAAGNHPTDTHEEHEWKLPVVTPTISAPSSADAGRVTLGDLGGSGEIQTQSYNTAALEPTSTGAEDLMQLMDDPATHLARLITELKSNNAEVRSMAAFLIGEAGTDAIAATGAMRSRLSTETSESIRIVIAEALGKMGSSDATSRGILVAGLKSASTDVRSASALALRVFKGDADHEIIDALKLALVDSEESVAAMAALSLSDFGPQAKSATQVLEAVRPTGSPELQQAIDSALGRIRQ